MDKNKIDKSNNKYDEIQTIGLGEKNREELKKEKEQGNKTQSL